MRLSQIAVKKPVTISMIFSGILIFGLLAFYALKLDMLPEVEYPSLTVVTVLPGASSEDVEQQVTKPLEKQLAGVPKIKSLKSVSKENVSFIMLEFNFGTIVGDATNDVRDRVAIVKKQLPSYAYDPMILKVDSSMMPVLMYGISAKESAPALAKIIDDRIEGRLKQVDGIGGLITLGAPKREIEIVVDPIKLRSSGISVSMIAKLLETQNISIPSGSIKTGGMDLSVRVPAEFESVDEIGNIQIPVRDGSMVKLSSLAEIKDRLKDQELSVRAEGKTMAVIMTQKQSGANTLEVAKNIKAAMEEIKKILPSDVVIEELNDASEVIKLSISNLGRTAIYAMIFVILAILFFLREWRGILIIALTIPFSLIIGLIFMYACGYTINIFSLMALSITLGMVVDNTIVVFENITRHIEEGSRPAEAAIFGSGEMTSAISASTLTTVAVFIPLAFVSGIVGLLFKQLAFVASITIAASLLVSLSFAPMLSSVLMKRKIKEAKHGFLYNASEKLFVFVENLYKTLLDFNIKLRWLVVIVIAIVFFFTIKVGLSTGTDYIPEFDMGDIVATAELESSVDAETTSEVAAKIEDIVKRNIDPEDVRTYYTITGQTDSGLLSMFGFAEGKNLATIMVKIVNRNHRNYHIKTVAAKIKKEAEEIPEIVSFTMTAGSLLQSAILGSSKPIEIKIKGNDLKKIAETGNKLHKIFEAQPYLQDVESTVDRGKPEIAIKFDRVKLARLGINAGMAALAVRESLYGANSGNFKQDNDEYDIIIRYDQEKRSRISDLKNIMLTSASGELIPLSAVGIIEETTGPNKILHETQQRIVYLKLTLNDISLGEATKKVMDIIKNEEIDPDVYIELGGQVVDQQSTFGDMKILFLISLFLIYAIMASQFESLRDPFIIMFTVPLSIIGVIWTFILTGTTLSAVTFVGIIILLGIVVNNGIVLVDYTNLLRGRGYSIVEAIKEGGRSRLRPVLMTATTTIVGMVPMALNNGAGSEIWKPLGITVIGGLTVSTLVTLLLIPAVYAIMHTREMIKEGKAAKAAREVEGGAQ